jgi:Sulfotransferase family
MSISGIVPSEQTQPVARPAVAGAPADTDQASIAGKPIYFFHIPKTGGRTIARHMIERFGLERIFHPEKSRSWLADFFMGEKIATRDDVADRHVAGHFAPISLLHGREQNYYKACFWRHPADWLLSFYNYRHFRQAERMKRDFTFADFQRSSLRNPMTEHLLLYAGGVPGWTYFCMSDWAKFEAALALTDRFDLFTDISKVDWFVKAIGYTEKGKPEDRNRIDRTRKKITALTQSVRRQVERRSPVDYYLHRIALGEDERVICAQAARRLRTRPDARDLLRLAALPYFRFRIWVLPFLPSVRGGTLSGASTGSAQQHPPLQQAGQGRTLH